MLILVILLFVGFVSILRNQAGAGSAPTQNPPSRASGIAKEVANPTKLENKPSQPNATDLSAQSKLKIVKDCVRLCNTTTNPDVFFARYDLMLEKCNELIAFESTIRFSGSPPSAQLRHLQNARERETLTFLKRSYEKMLENTKKLKTAKGQENKVEKYFLELEKYSHYLSQAHLDIIEHQRRTTLVGKTGNQ